MEFMTIALLVVGALMLLTVVVMLRRSWGSSLGRAPAPDQYRPPAESAAPSEADLAEIRTLAARGDKIEAIKRYRERTGVGLKEAKDFVEALPATGAVKLPVSPPHPAPDLAEVHALALAGNKIEAIKRYRERTGVGLKEAKDYVDSLS